MRASHPVSVTRKARPVQRARPAVTRLKRGNMLSLNVSFKLNRWQIATRELTLRDTRSPPPAELEPIAKRVRVVTGDMHHRHGEIAQDSSDLRGACEIFELICGKSANLDRHPRH